MADGDRCTIDIVPLRINAKAVPTIERLSREGLVQLE
jgi:hypothetical protein